MFASAPPGRPSPRVERVAQGLYLALAPRLPRGEPRDPPSRLGSFEALTIDRSGGSGELAGTLYRSSSEVPRRGVVVLAHPWHAHGQGYFHRRGRMPRLRAAGYDVVSFDFGGFGRSGPRPSGFFDRDLDDVLDWVTRWASTLPVHVWGVSAGGYWAHPVLTRRDDVTGAVFEDVAVHLIEWSKRLAPVGLPFYLVFQHLLSPAYLYLDLRRHAPCLRVGGTAYIGGADDPGALADETRTLAELAGGACRIVPGAGHLDAIRVDPEGVVDLALSTFARAEAARLVPTVSAA